MSLYRRIGLLGRLGLFLVLGVLLWGAYWTMGADARRDFRAYYL